MTPQVAAALDALHDGRVAIRAVRAALARGACLDAFESLLVAVSAIEKGDAAKADPDGWQVLLRTVGDLESTLGLFRRSCLVGAVRPYDVRPETFAGLAGFPEDLTLRARIARTLGWSVEETKQFSLQALRELVRPKSPELAAMLDDEIRRGSYSIGGLAGFSGLAGARRGFSVRNRPLDRTHHPFKRSERIGVGPRGSVNVLRNDWECGRIAKHVQKCIYVGANRKRFGKAKIVRTKPDWKADYNREYWDHLVRAANRTGRAKYPNRARGGYRPRAGRAGG